MTPALTKSSPREDLSAPFNDNESALFNSTRSLKPAGQAYDFPSPLHLLMALVNAGALELHPHRWQAEELTRLGGYLNPQDLSNRVIPSRDDPLLYCLPAANSSGKDQFIIAVFAVWFAMQGVKNRCIITSSSFDQVKDQTEPHINAIADACNIVFGQIFRSVRFHHVCLTTGSEIKLFATDSPQNAEGYHPWPGGRMAIIINEAKGVTEPIFDALTRCEGYSYWMEISSPGARSGRFYRHARGATQYPQTPKLGEFWVRYISAFDCPHISKSHIARAIAEMPRWWVDSSIRALFSSIDEHEVIPGHFYEALLAALPKPLPGDIGIGLDTAAGVDENSLYVRSGNEVIYSYHFRQRDTTETVMSLDTILAPWRSANYIFNSDDGGVSHAIVDGLVKLGWRINRRHNQSPARNKSRFLNLGADMWTHLRKLIIRKEIIPPKDTLLEEQLTSRRYDGQESAQGKLKLEPKPDHKSRTGSSPDRADALVLCFYSYQSRYFDAADSDKPAAKQPLFASIADLASRIGWEDIEPPKSNDNRRFTFQASSNI